MTAWSEAPGRGILGPTTKGSASCPRCGDTLLSDSRFCRCCGHALGTDLGAPYTEDSNSATDGLQFLCSKYSALITRLREEVLAHQQAQAECRRLERRLREESQSWAQEKEQLMLDLQRLRVEVDSLNRLAERQRADAPCKPAREHGAKELHPQPVKPAEADTNAWHQYEAQQKQHQQMMSLLNEHSQLQVETRDAQDELTACRDHLARWRRKATDLETQKMTAERHREDAEKKARCMQDELRQALRSASLAKSRQKEAERVAKQEESQAKDLEERLKALRYDSRLNARRASGAVGRLAAAEAMEQRTGRLEHEVADLQQQLRLALDQGAELRVKHQRSEEAEQHAVLRAGEVLGELKASEAMSSGQQARLKDLEVQLLSARDSLAQAEHDRANHSSWTQRLGHELADARANEQEARLREAQQGQELRDAQRRLEQLVGGASTPGELARCQKRLAELEQVCSRQEAELAEERRARERCHLEAVKSGEKLRLARAQGAQMKERVKSLEEAELRYPSRFPPRSIKNLRLGSARSASLPAEPRARGTGHRAQGVPWEPRTAGRAERQVNEPVAKEARWSWEEQPRAALPQAEPQDSGLAAMLPKACAHEPVAVGQAFPSAA